MYELLSIINFCFGLIAVAVVVSMTVDYFRFSWRNMLEDRYFEENQDLKAENAQLKSDVANLLEENRKLREQGINRTRDDSEI